MDEPYMKLMRNTMHYLHAWPNSRLGEPRRAFPMRHRCFLLGLHIILTTTEIVYIKNNIRRISFLQMGNSYITTLMSLVMVHRFTLSFMDSYQDVSKLFVSEIHLQHHRHKSDHAMKVHNQVNRICSFLCYLLHVQIVISVFLFNATAVINNYRAGMYSSVQPANGTRYELPVYYQTNFDYETNFIGYVGMSLVCVTATIDVGIVFGIFDVYLCLMVFHIWGHLKILEYNLRNFPRPAMATPEGCSSLEDPPMFSPEESKNIAQLLKENIDHHTMLMNFVNKTSSAFGPMLGIYCAFHQVCCCILLLECSTMESAALAKYLPLTVCMFQQLMQVSIIFELIGSKSDNLADAVYNVPWECMGNKERRSVVIFLCNVRTPISLTALGLVPVGVRTMVAIIKTSLSYFVMLRTISQ